MTLKSELDQFGVLFKEHLRGSAKASLRWVTAESVDWDNRTMTATDADRLAFNNVLLGVGAVAVKPKQGTDCLISIVEGDEASTILIYAHEADLIQYNDGGNGGLVTIGELTAKLNGLVGELNTQLDLIATGITGAGGAYTPGTISNFSKSDYENTKITH